MSPAKRHPTGFVFTERARELDHEHRKRLRGALPLTLSMRYLATAFERLRRGTAPAKARLTPRPPEGTVAITGVDYAELGSDGRLQSVSGFFGTGVPEEAAA